MKKIFLTMLISLFAFSPVLAKSDKLSEEYLKNKKHLALLNPFVETAAQKVIKKALVKEIGAGKYDVDLDGYTLGSMKKGIFKSLEIKSKDLTVNEIPVRHLNLKTLTDYNWIDFNENPVKIKSNLTFAYDMEITEKSINSALKQKDYQRKMEKVNSLAYPLFTLQDVRVRIRHDKVHIIMDYTLPLASSKKTRSFMVSSDFKVDNGKIKASNVGFDNSYGNLPLDKVTNLVNLVDPLSFTLAQLCEENCKGNIENVKIENNNIQIDGKIFVVKK